MRRNIAIILIILIFAGFAVPLIGCDSKLSEAEQTENQMVTVERGDLAIDITAAGNLALSRTEDLAFDTFYPEATVEAVLVEEGDIIKEGQVLASLDTEEWEDELSALEDALASAERSLVQAEINLKNAEINLDEAEGIYTWPEVEVAQAELDDAEAFLEYVLEEHYGDSIVRYAQSRYEAAESKLNAMIMDYDIPEIIVKKLEIELDQGRLEDAQKALEDAQKALDKAKSKSPLIVAPFGGFVTTVNVEGGDEVMTGTVAVQIADPDRFEVDILVSEMDILQLKEGGEAQVQVDAIPGLSLPAEVTHISPTATIQSSVVNYEVKVEVESLEDLQLREGLTVTVTIIVEERNDVLLVPNSAITSQGGQTYVQVVSPNGTLKKRAITTGISNWQYTEVSEGLSEGEQVIIPQGKTTSVKKQGQTSLPLFRK
jgi:multidrug efflux pump subunit AcrA (membrane-fusion protein)